jgi:hypothetical protein
MAAEAKREPGLLRLGSKKLRESWRRAGAIEGRAVAARRAHEDKADKYRPGRPGDPGIFGGGF